VVVGLRRRDGVDREAFEQSSGFSLDAIAGGAVRRWVAGGLAQDNGQRVQLTRKGLLVSDALWAAILNPEAEKEA
jgi:coproporphyrinogen III oxidase-like Fe-S oxidoreductase